MSTLNLQRFTHPFFQANAWLLTNATHAILIDTASNDSEDGARVAKFVKNSNRKLQAILLSHGHPDIWLGVKRLHEMFPEVPIYAPTNEVLEDIIGMGQVMDQYGMLAKTPDLAPARYDYRAAIQVLGANQIRLEGNEAATLMLETNYPPSEHTHITTAFVPEMEGLFVSDLAYNHVHSWGGIGVDRQSIENWLGILDELIAKYGKTGVRVFAGHGPETDANVFYTQRAYLEDLLAAVDVATSDEDFQTRMSKRFPHYAGAGFQLAMTSQNRGHLKRES